MEVDSDTPLETSFQAPESVEDLYAGLRGYNVSDTFLLKVSLVWADFHDGQAKASLEAVEEVIHLNEAITSLSPSVYFAAILTALERAKLDVAPELLYLWSICLRKVPVQILRTNFVPALNVLSTVLKLPGSTEDIPLVRSALNCIGNLLLAQERSKSFWKQPKALQVFQVLLSYSLDDRIKALVRPIDLPQLRKTAKQQAVLLLEAHANAKCQALSAYSSAFFREVLSGCTSADPNRICRVLSILHFVMPLYSRKDMAACCEVLFKFIRLGIPRVTVLVLRVFHGMITHAPQSVMIPAFIEQLLSFLLDLLVRAVSSAIHVFQPEFSNPDSTAELCYTLASMGTRLVTGIPAGGERENLAASDGKEYRRKRSLSADSMGAVTSSSAASRETIARLLPKTVAGLARCFLAHHPTVHQAACVSLTSILSSCITPQLVEEALGASSTFSSPLRQIMETLESLSQMRFQPAFDYIFKVLTPCFVALGHSACPVAGRLLASLAMIKDDVENNTTEKFPSWSRKLTEALSTACRVFNPEQFLQCVPLQAQDGCLNPQRQWLISLLEANTPIIGMDYEDEERVVEPATRFAFFRSHVLGIARKCEAAARDLAAAGNDTGAKLQKLHSMQMWALFPAWCYHPVDFAAEFSAFAPILGNALEDSRYPELQSSVARGLQILLSRSSAAASVSAKDSGATEESIPEEYKAVWTAAVDDVPEAKGGSFKDPIKMETGLADAIHEKMRALASRFFPLLLNAVLRNYSRQDVADRLLSSLGEYSKVADTSFVNAQFAQIIERLLMSGVLMKRKPKPDDDDSMEMAAPDAVTAESFGVKDPIYLSIAIVLAPQLEPATISVLLNAITPLLGADHHPRIQKKAYQLMCSIILHHSAVIQGQPGAVEQLLGIVRRNHMLCTVSARGSRLQCMFAVLALLDLKLEPHVAFVRESMGEVVVAVKDSSHRSRRFALTWIKRCAELFEAKKCEGATVATGEGVMEWMLMVMAGLASPESGGKSATLLGLSSLMFEYSSLPAVRNIITKLLQTVLLCLHDAEREVVKAALAFVKVSAVILNPKELTENLELILKGVMRCPPEPKKRFRRRIRYILEKLSRKCGYDAVAEHIPRADLALLAHIRKMRDRMLRKKMIVRDQEMATAADGTVSGVTEEAPADVDDASSVAVSTGTRDDAPRMDVVPEGAFQVAQDEYEGSKYQFEELWGSDDEDAYTMASSRISATRSRFSRFTKRSKVSSRSMHKIGPAYEGTYLKERTGDLTDLTALVSTGSILSGKPSKKRKREGGREEDADPDEDVTVRCGRECRLTREQFDEEGMLVIGGVRSRRSAPDSSKKFGAVSWKGSDGMEWDEDTLGALEGMSAQDAMKLAKEGVSSISEHMKQRGPLVKGAQPPQKSAAPPAPASGWVKGKARGKRKDQASKNIRGQKKQQQQKKQKPTGDHLGGGAAFMPFDYQPLSALASGGRKRDKKRRRLE